MFIRKLDPANKEIIVSIPLTKGTEKTRIKKRSMTNEYGLPVATRTEAFTQNCYVEWQIGYDVITADEEKLQRTTIKDKLFIGANGKQKTLYELSEYIYYFYQWGIITRKDLEDVLSFLDNIDQKLFLDVNTEYVIERTHPIPRELFNIKFEYTQVKYPLLVHKFLPYEVITEILITEKQYAIGVQPMLYFCFPITELATNVLGRVAQPKETADFIINAKNINVFLEMLKIFGILSKNHNADIHTIIQTILK